MGSCRVRLVVSLVALLACNCAQALAQSVPLKSSLTEDDGTDYASDVPVTDAAPISTAPTPEDEPPLPRKPKKIADPYMPPPMGDGPIDYRASLTVQGVYSSNVKSSANAARGDLGLRLVPLVSFNTNWSRHEWHGTATGDFITYAATPSANAYSGSIETGGRLDIRRDTKLDLDGSVATSLSTAGDPEVPGSAVGSSRSWTINSTAALEHDYGPFSSRVKLGLQRNLYNDVALSTGGVESNADRNYWEPSLALRGTWGSQGARLKPYVEVSYNPRLHDTLIDRNGQNRNSQGGGLAVGVNLDDGPIWMGDISANFIARDYNDPALKTAMALGLNGSLTWSPTPLWSIVASSSVGLSESEQIGVSATPNWTNGLQASYGLRDNVKLNAGLNLSASSATGGLDTTTVASFGADWQLNPYLSLSGSLQSTWYRAASGSGDYSEQRVMTGIALRH